MYRKRRATESLTGGTGDVNPQVMNLSLTMSGADTFTTTGVNLPVNRLPGVTASTAVIIEILKIAWDVTLSIGSSAGTYSTMAALTTSPQTALTDATKSDPTMIDFYQETILNLGGATTGITSLAIAPTFHDLSDNAGHGMLIATDKIFLSISKSRKKEGPTLRKVFLRIFYRYTVRPAGQYARRRRGGSRACALPLQGSVPRRIHWHRAKPAVVICILYRLIFCKFSFLNFVYLFRHKN